MARWPYAGAALLVAASLGAVSRGEISSGAPSPTAAVNWWHPGQLTSWQYAIGEPFPIAVPTDIGDVEAYDIDEGNLNGVSASEVGASVAAIHAQGAKAICYVDTGGWENYRSDASEYASAILGSPVPGYSDERYVDIRQWSDDPGPTGMTLGQVLTARFQLCQDEGFDGVETDLDDTYTDSTGFPLTMTDEVRFMTEVADVVHGLGMAWFLKNGINGDSFISDLEPLADGTVNEQCWQYDECSALAPFVQAGKPVLNVEYADEAEATTCPHALAFPMATMHTDEDLDGTIAWACWQYGATTSTPPAVGLRPQAPKFVSPARATATVGQRFSFQLTASGNPLPVLGHSKLPIGLRWARHGPGRATISGAPKAPAAGLTRVLLSAVNSRGRARQVLTILVRRRPGLSSGAPPAATVGRRYRFVFSVYGFPVPSLRELGTLPAGLVFRQKGDGHATLSGLPAAGSKGAHLICVRVSNSLGALTVHYVLRVVGK
jgi:hypothetical protein